MPYGGHQVRILITGITGFVGSHLAEYLLSLRDESKPHSSGLEIAGEPIETIFGTARNRSRLDYIEGIMDRITLIPDVEIRDAHAVAAAVKKTEPDYIFHLAAQSFVPASWNAPADTIETNVKGTVNLLEAVRMSELHPVIQIAGSSEEYGCPPMVEDNSLIHFGVNQMPKMVFKVPITEEFPLMPLSPYGVSKVAEDLLGFQYHKSYGMKIVRTRAFNHTGPRRGESFATSNFAKQIVEIEKGMREPVLKAGNLEARRDFTDVRDIVRGYWLAASRGKYGEVYNLCSGKARSIQSVLDTLRLQSTAQFEIVQDRERMRPSDIPVLEGDCSKFTKQTGWKPKIGFSQTMGDLLDYWREKI